jgi:hypothetical protein
MNVIWVKQYTGQVTFGKNSIVPYGGNILLAGDITGTANLGGAYNFNSTTTSPFMMQIDPLGNTQMAFVLAGMGGMNTLNITPDLKIVTTGYISGSIDMDPSNASIPLNAASTTSFTAVYTTPLSGLFTQQPKLDFDVYPNPASSYIQINFKQSINASVQIIDALGRIVAVQKVDHQDQCQISCEELSAGMYYVSLIDSEHNFNTQKLIVR